MRLSLPQLVALAQRHGFPDPRLAAEGDYAAHLRLRTREPA